MALPHEICASSVHQGWVNRGEKSGFSSSNKTDDCPKIMLQQILRPRGLPAKDTTTKAAKANNRGRNVFILDMKQGMVQYEAGNEQSREVVTMVEPCPAET